MQPLLLSTLAWLCVPRFSHDTSTCRSVGSTVRHDAMLTGATLSHAGNAESERAAARNKSLWRPMDRKWDNSPVGHPGGDGGMAVLRFKHDTSSCRNVLSAAVHDAKPPYSTLSHAIISESE